MFLRSVREVQSQGAQRIRGRIHVNKQTKTIPRHTIYTWQKIKDKGKILKESGEENKQLTCRGANVRIAFDFSETMQIRRE